MRRNCEHPRNTICLNQNCVQENWTELKEGLQERITANTDSTLPYFRRRQSSQYKSLNDNNIQTMESLCVMSSQHSISRAAECECSLVTQGASLSYLRPCKRTSSASSLCGILKQLTKFHEIWWAYLALTVNVIWAERYCNLRQAWVYLKPSVRVLWAERECPLSRVWMYLELSVKVRWGERKCTLNSAWVYLELSVSVSWAERECTLSRAWVSFEPSVSVLWTDHECTLSWAWVYFELSVSVHWTERECTLSWAWVYLELRVSVPWAGHECLELSVSVRWADRVTVLTSHSPTLTMAATKFPSLRYLWFRKTYILKCLRCFRLPTRSRRNLYSSGSLRSE